MYEASAKEEYLLWAIRLQQKQDELFFDRMGGGYFASAPDEHILVRMKDAQASLGVTFHGFNFLRADRLRQDGAEPSAVSVTLSNLQRLAHFAEDSHAAYNDKAKSILASNGQLLKQASHAMGTLVGNALMGGMGYKQVRPTTGACLPIWSPT